MSSQSDLIMGRLAVRVLAVCVPLLTGIAGGSFWMLVEMKGDVRAAITRLDDMDRRITTVEAYALPRPRP